MMKMCKILAYTLAILFLIVACKKNKPGGITVEPVQKMEIFRFDEALFGLPQADFKSWATTLREAHPAFFDLFTYEVVRIGGIEDSLFFDELNRFVTDTMIQNVKALVGREFADFAKTEKEIVNALENYKGHFPEKEIPEVYACISGFNQSVVIADGIVGVSLDKYLGPGCPYYDRLGYARFLQQKMVQSRLPIDLIYGLATTEFVKSDAESNLLSHIIYEGKLLYFIDVMFPKYPDSLKIGYTAKQLEWCKKNEPQMWTNLVENKRLYATGRMDIKRLIDDSPYTNGFPLESPGRTGVWIGWQIVRKYMGKNPEVTLPQLMRMEDSQKILNDSKYFPD